MLASKTPQSSGFRKITAFSTRVSLFLSVISDICFCRIRAEIFDGALWALGLFCHANTAAMVLHQMTEADALFGRDDCRQVSFDFVRVGFAGES